MFPTFVEAFQQDIYAKPQCMHKEILYFRASVLIVAITALGVIVTVSCFQGTNSQILQRWCCLLLPSTDD